MLRSIKFISVIVTLSVQPTVRGEPFLKIKVKYNPLWLALNENSSFVIFIFPFWFVKAI